MQSILTNIKSLDWVRVIQWVLFPILFIIAFTAPQPLNIDDATIEYFVIENHGYDCKRQRLEYSVLAQVKGRTVFTETMLIVFSKEESRTVFEFPSLPVEVYREAGEDLPEIPVSLVLPAGYVPDGQYELRFAADLWGAGVAGFTVPFVTDCEEKSAEP